MVISTGPDIPEKQNSVDPDLMPQNAASGQGLPCLPFV